MMVRIANRPTPPVAQTATLYVALVRLAAPLTR
jgi:hypothetical protein